MNATSLPSLSTRLVLSLIIFSISPLIPAAKDELVLEDGYTVTTAINGHKLKVNPYSVIPKPASSHLILLDSSTSSFYIIPFPVSKESRIKRLSGTGATGFVDGDLDSAKFNRPRSFAIDLKGNVYVADQANYAIRKISNSGGAMRVTTIAGGYSHKPGSEDGPAQNATFSSDFSLLFVPDICALLISDHGNQLIRQIDLKQEDCIKGSKPTLETTLFWILGLSISCLIGMVIGVAIRSYLVPHEGFRHLHFSVTWKHCLTNLLKLVPLMLCCDIRSAVANFGLFALLRRLLQLCASHLSLMLGINTFSSQSSNKGFVSLLNSDVNSSNVENSPMHNQLKDLIDFQEDWQLVNTKKQILGKGEGDKNSFDVLPNIQGKVDSMILDNIVRFTQVTRETNQLDWCLVGASGLVTRRGSCQN